MSEILFISHRIPFPPDRGDKIRSHHILRRLAAMAPVHVATFVETDEDVAQESELAALAASHCTVKRTRPLPYAALLALAERKPVSLTAFASEPIRRYVAQVLATRPVSTIVVFSGQMAQYVPPDFAGRVVMDFVDVDSAKFEDYARRAPFPLSLMHRREALLLRRFEESAARRATDSLLCTPEEAALFCSRLSAAGSPPVHAMGNGIDAKFYDPSGIVPASECEDAGPNIVFTGQMDYPPNVEAVTMFAREVMPRVRQAHPGARFHVVGRAPTAAVRALELDGDDGTLVHGAVPDVRPWLAGADLVTAPLLIARGVQNKVLEAMAMGRAVLVTSPAATGIGARDAIELAVADGAHALAERASLLLSQPSLAADIGLSARRFVVAEKGWDGVLAPLAGWCGFSGAEQRHAA